MNQTLQALKVPAVRVLNLFHLHPAKAVKAQAAVTVHAVRQNLHPHPRALKVLHRKAAVVKAVLLLNRLHH